MAAFMKEVERVIRAGGYIRFTWETCSRELVSADGTAVPLDGRTYHALCISGPPVLRSRISTGSTEEKNLVIEFRP